MVITMEKKLKQMFEYQRFAQNPRLEAIIRAAEDGARELSDDDLSAVNAAGDQVVRQSREPQL